MQPSGKGFVPIALVTGFYGSGKTSLLQNLATKLVAPASSPLSIALVLRSLSEGALSLPRHVGGSRSNLLKIARLNG